MEVKAEKAVFKYSKFVDVNLKNDNETHLTMNQETVDKQKAEKLVVSWFEDNNLPKVKDSNVKIGFKTLVGLFFVLLMIVAGLAAGLILMDLKVKKLERQNQELDNGWENDKETVSKLELQNQNLTKALESQVQIAKSLKIRNKDIMMGLETLRQNHLNAKIEIEKMNLEYQNLQLEKDAMHEYLNHSMNSTKLLDAAAHGDLDKVRLLLKLGVDANVHDSSNMTSLHFASYYGYSNSKEIAELLLQNGAKVDARDKGRYTPLLLAAYHGQFEIAKLLLDNGADVNAKDEEQSTPLHLAAYNGHAQIVELLLKHGAIKGLRNNDSQNQNKNMSVLK